MNVDFGITKIDFDAPAKLPIPEVEGHHVISLGAGVQSSTLALMAAEGIFGPMPEAAIFADTQAEPESVYTWLDWLEKQLPFPVYRVTEGNLTEDSKELITSKNGIVYPRVTLPFFVKNPRGTPGLLKRQCTQHYKVAPVHRKLRELYKKEKVIQWFGISWDETQRMKDSNKKNIIHRYPLIERGISRSMCIAWMAQNGYQRPPRSACVYCPFRHDEDWRGFRDNEPEAYARAIDYDEEIRKVYTKVGFADEVFLHRSCLPLADIPLDNNDQMDLFGNECEGYCGI